MIDDTIVNEALRIAWEHQESNRWESRFDSYESALNYSWGENRASEMLDKMDDDVESVRKQFYFELVARVPRKESRTFVSVDDIADRIRKAAPSLAVSGTRDGIAVELPGDAIGISVYKKWQVSVHSRKNHYGWDATMWEPDDIAAAVVAMGRFEELSAPLKEAYRARCEERKRRSDIMKAFREATWGLRDSVRSALDAGTDTGAIRDGYIPLRKAMYADLGDPFDDAVLEGDWKEFVDDVTRRWEEDRKYAAREAARLAREESRERAKNGHAEALSRTLGRECQIVRRSPYAMTHWDEYIVELEDGEKVWFKDYTRTLGSLDAAIADVVPVLEEFTGFATTKLGFGACPARLRYSTRDRDLCRREFLRLAGDDEVMLHLGERMKPANLRVILRPAKRTVKLYCYYPHRGDMAVSFTIGGIESKEDVDRLADVVARFQAVMKKHGCNLG